MTLGDLRERERRIIASGRLASATSEPISSTSTSAAGLPAVVPGDKSSSCATSPALHFAPALCDHELTLTELRLEPAGDGIRCSFVIALKPAPVADAPLSGATIIGRLLLSILRTSGADHG